MAGQTQNAVRSAGRVNIDVPLLNGIMYSFHKTCRWSAGLTYNNTHTG